MTPDSQLRALPSVEELAQRLEGVPHPVAVESARAAIADARDRIRAGVQPPDVAAEARERAERALRPSLRRVLNATGVIVHTNLGRSPLAASALEALAEVGSGYSNLEYDLAERRRGSRRAHAEQLLVELTGAEAALVVNNCAAAVLLAAAALAATRELVVSRGQLIEIGGSFRVPEVVEQSGATLVEVGTTNRTRLDDYRSVLGERTGAILRAHPSNFRSLGFVEAVSIEELCGLGVPVIDDIGSGALAQGLPQLSDEPPVRRSVAAGCAVVCFSGDKLLGGPQAGLMVGAAEAIERCARHPLARALRIDKLSLAALEATLRLYLDPATARRELPVLRMLAAEPQELRARADAICSALRGASLDVEVIEAAAKVGGGALPLLELEGPVCAVTSGPLTIDALTARLHAGEPPLVGRVHRGRLLLDPRTLTDADVGPATRAVIAALHA